MEKGTFIVIDGGEGSGKTTVAAQVKEALGGECVLTHDPGGAPFSKLVRGLVLTDDAKHADAETLFALFWASRRDLLVHTIAPALAEGKTVVCDRFDSSTWAYQIKGQQQPRLAELFWSIRAHFLSGLKPARYIILDVAAEEGARRVEARGSGKNHFGVRPAEFHERVRAGFLDFVEQKQIAGTVVDAHHPLAQVSQDVITHIQEYNK